MFGNPIYPECLGNGLCRMRFWREVGQKPTSLSVCRFSTVFCGLRPNFLFERGKLMNASTINQIVSVGSVDGISTTAALLRVIGNPNVGIVFCQAFSVDKIDPTKWEPGRVVAFVDLAVNNQDHAMTADFVKRVKAAGHTIVAIIDEHSREDWAEVYGPFGGLLIEPQSQAAGVFGSSADVLGAWLHEKGIEIDGQTQSLLIAGSAGDKRDFSTHFGAYVNQAVKSAIADDTRRVYMAKHFAFSTVADEKILGWCAEYEAILLTHETIIAARVELGSGMIRVNTVGKKIDMTTLMDTLYKQGATVVVLEGMAFNPASKEDPTQPKQLLQVSFGTDDKSIDLMACVKASGLLPIGGFAQKVNMKPEDEAAAVAAIRSMLMQKSFSMLEYMLEVHGVVCVLRDGKYIIATPSGQVELVVTDVKFTPAENMVQMPKA